MESTATKEKSNFQLGDTKTLTKFAWLPTFVGNSLIWFKNYNQHYEYKKTLVIIPDILQETGTLLDYGYIIDWVETTRSL